jgi:outer membrane protein assembly factor BamB
VSSQTASAGATPAQPGGSGVEPGLARRSPGPAGRRRALAIALAVAALAGAAAVGHRVLGPAEVSATSTEPYPTSQPGPPGVTGRALSAPLLVDGSIRVYAAKRQVRADGPVDAVSIGIPRWSYRRWPAQLNGVVALGPTVVTRWSDGELVALNARTGVVAWRFAGPGGGTYDGRRTGAATVYAPDGLRGAAPNVLASDGRRLVAVDAAAGALRWRADLPADCRANGFTTAGGRYVCGGIAYDVRTGRPDPSWSTGPRAPLAPGPTTSLAPGPSAPAAPGPSAPVISGPTAPFAAGSAPVPLGCGPARSGCAGLRDVAGRGWLASDPAARRAPALDPPGVTLAAGLAISPPGRQLVARSPLTGAEVWRWSAGGDAAQVLAAEPGAVHLLTDARDLVTLNAADGSARSRFRLAYRLEGVDWVPGLVQAAHGHVVVERLRAPADPAAKDPLYYFRANAVVIARTGVAS